MTVSVLICTYNRPQLLGRALASILRDSEEKPDQLVLVNGGDPEVRAVLNEYSSDATTEVCYIETQNVNLATSRNIGLAACTCDIVAMTDDDAEVFPDWISQTRRLHDVHRDAAVIGGAAYGKGAGLIFEIADAITFPFNNSMVAVRTVPGVNATYKRRFIEMVGDQDVTLFRGEDVDYNWRMLKHDGKVLYSPDLKVWHHHRATFSGLVRQHWMYGRAYYLVRRKWPDMYCVYPHSFTSMRDILKTGYFFLSILTDQTRNLRRIRSNIYTLPAFPILMLLGSVWRGGMMYQFIVEMNDRR